MVRKTFNAKAAQTPADIVLAALQPEGQTYTLSEMLFAACEARMPVLVRGILALGADPSLLTPRFLQMQPLHMSCQSGDVLSTAHLIAAQAPLNNRMNTLEESPLHKACSVFVKSDDVAAQLAYLLLSAGAEQGQKIKLLNQTEIQMAQASGKSLTSQVLRAFNRGAAHEDASVAHVRTLVASTLGKLDNDPVIFLTEVRKPDVKAAMAAKLTHSWCDRP